MAAPAQLEVFAPITKRERDPKTGHLYVYGKITGSDLDHDQQRMDPSWLKTAVPDWFRVGNLREQHDAKRAIGKAIELEEKEDGWYIGAKVVDESAAEKVEEDVLTGFSIGIKNYQLDRSNKTDAPNGLVIAGRICETSLVDAPCLGSAKITDHYRLPLAKADGAGELQPIEDPELIRTDADPVANTFGLPAELYDRLAAPVKEALANLAAGGATVTAEAAKADTADGITPVVVNVSVQTPETPAPEIAKADLSTAARRKAATAGAAMPDGSYPIRSKGELRKAIKAVGRGNADHDKIRAHIVKRAKALGLEAMVPDNWNADGSLNANKADEETVAKAEQVLRDTRALAPSLVKADDGEGDGGDGDETEDIAGAEQAIAVIAKLIIAEAESLAMGNLNEACDIDLLLSAVRSLTWFKKREEAEQQGDGADADMGLADQPDAEKAAGKNGGKLAPPFGNDKKTSGADGADEDEDEEDDDADGKKKPAATKSDVPTLTKADVTELVKSAVAEATKAAEERVTALAADLAKAQQTIKALPQPGGPVLTRTNTQEDAARKSDAALLRAQASEFLAKADACSDRYLADGYREKAQEILAKANA